MSISPSFWNAPDPTTTFSAILSHCWTGFPGGSAAHEARGARANRATITTARASDVPRVPSAGRNIMSRLLGMPDGALHNARKTTRNCHRAGRKMPLGMCASDSDEEGRRRGRLTTLLLNWTDGDRAAMDELAPLVYDELRRLARRQMAGERQGHLLQPTALVNEAFLRLVDIHQVQW